MITSPPCSTMEVTGFPHKWKRVRHGLLLTLLLLCSAGCANNIFYQPSRRLAPAPDQRGLKFEEVAFTASDGVALTGWWLPATPPVKGTVIHFHGNAQNMTTHIGYTEWLPAQGYHLFVFDYRGYGTSAGSPSRRGLIRDGMAALEAVSTHPEVTPDHILVWGQSLGGTVALQSMAHSEVSIQAALIDSTFSSHGKIASEKMRQFPWFLQPLRLFRPLLVSSSYNAVDAVKALPDLPLFFMHGEKDPVIPPSHSRTLQALAPEHSRLWVIPQAGHCDAVLRFPEQVQPEILKFFADPEAGRY